MTIKSSEPTTHRVEPVPAQVPAATAPQPPASSTPNAPNTHAPVHTDPVPAEGITFRIGFVGALIPPLVFLAGVILYFVVFGVFDMTALTASGVAGLLLAGLFAKSYGRYWEWVIAGVTSRNAGTLLFILLAVSLIAAMITQTDVSGGFVWLAGQLGIGGGVFVAATFVLVCLISMATGSSLGTMFTAFPIFYPAGVLLGADPILLAGAILSGGLFGDNLAPISDSTIVSASTQRYRRRAGVAEVAGVVRSRARYALTAAGISAVLFLVLGLLRSGTGVSDAAVGDQGNPLGLVMVVPIAVLLVVAFWKRDIFLATTIGLISGIATGLLFGLMTPSDIMSVTPEGAPGGFLITGIAGMLPLVGLGIVVFGITGVLQGAGVFDRIVALVGRSARARTPLGSELAIGLGAAVTTTVFAGINSPAMLLFGPVADRLGAAARLHPFRRANVMDCFTLGIGAVIPIGSVFLLISSQLTSGYGEGVPEVSAVSIFTAAFYPFALTLIMLIAVVTGWGRRFEGENGAEVRTQPTLADADADSDVAVPDPR
ncbi:Na+/H+ antiporter NhaC family protein [Herbiconiux sp.]|uniref:Na+/H+ antiporter NhaC family protein n=1 Tax=Herbiconiux sp. TaxID=1871186 RepID=UPI0025B9582D|nr:Na+/H+ antiporter NhaC family protein [Herbiconiux sp.]